MTIAGKVTVATLGAGGAALIGCYAGGLIKTGESSSTEIAPTSSPVVIPWSSLASDSNFTTTYNVENSTTAGKEYGKYLTGIDESNKAWWESSYKQYEQDAKVTGNTTRAFSDHFAPSNSNNKVTAAYSSDLPTALNKVCEEAYKKNLTTDVDFDFTTTTISNNSEAKYKLAADILRYCSPLGQLPTTIPTDNNTYADGKIGKKGATNKFVSVEGTTNDGFWKAQNEWFKTKGNATPALDAYFNQFFAGGNNAKTLQEGKDIKAICTEAYNKAEITESSSTTSSPIIGDVVKYCSFGKLSVQ